MAFGKPNEGRRQWHGNWQLVLSLLIFHGSVVVRLCGCA